jgi:hypothetical protein
MAPSRALHRPSLLATAAAAMLLLLLILPPSAAAVPPPALFIFGDSLVDAGNNDYLVTLSKANGPPYGIDFESSGGKPTGRFTNGMTIADIMGN